MSDRKPERSPSLAEQLAHPAGHVRVLERCAEEVMTPGVLAMPVTASLERTAQAMAHHRVHGVLVVSCEGRPCGWVTIEAITPKLGDGFDLDWAVDAIGEPLVTVSPTTTLRQVVAAFRERGVSRVAVSRRPELIPEGVISSLDVAGLLGGKHGGS